MEISIKGEKIFEIFNLTITNTLLMSWLVLLVFISTVFFIRKKLTLVPKTAQNIIEFIIENIINMLKEVLGSKEKAEKYFPFIATIFLFVLLNNWFGILPIIGSIGLFQFHDSEKIFIPLFRSAASDLNFTMALAVISVILTNIYAVKALGFASHFKKFFSFQSPIQFFVGLLEFISEFAKIISFSFRLFGNIFAGEVLLIIISFLVPYGGPAPFLLLEIFVGFIQALVFAMLTLVFIGISTAEHHN